MRLWIPSSGLRLHLLGLLVAFTFLCSTGFLDASLRLSSDRTLHVDPVLRTCGVELSGARCGALRTEPTGFGLLASGLLFARAIPCAGRSGGVRLGLFAHWTFDVGARLCARGTQAVLIWHGMSWFPLLALCHRSHQVGALAVRAILCAAGLGFVRRGLPRAWFVLAAEELL